MLPGTGSGTSPPGLGVSSFPGPAKPFPCCQDGRRQGFLGAAWCQPWFASALLVCRFTVHGRLQETHAELHSPRVGQTGGIHFAAALQGACPTTPPGQPRLGRSCSTWDGPGDGKASAASVPSTLNSNRFIVKRTLKGWLSSLTEVQEKKTARVCPIHLSLRKSASPPTT